MTTSVNKPLFSLLNHKILSPAEQMPI